MFFQYLQVFQCLQSSMATSVVLKSAVADFEAGMWTGFRGVFPHIQIKGCSFHWGQAVFRKLRSLGLEPAYHGQDATRKLLRKILALPYLPVLHIQPAFEELKRFATTPALMQLMDYINATWMHSSVWAVSSWSVFGRAIRTNNDVEGWHRRLNHSATRSNVQFYMLIPLLYREAGLVSIQMKLVSEGKLKRQQRKAVREMQARVMALWDSYRKGHMTASVLLREISQMKGL